MYTATFMIRIANYDDDFHRLNQRIIDVAEANPGYLGRESWEQDDRNVVILYWRSLEDLERFANHPDHLEAKRQYQRWYGGYRVLVAQVLRDYGDGAYPGKPEDC
jgi:heme-degrading monooxygenase HmoA